MGSTTPNSHPSSTSTSTSTTLSLAETKRAQCLTFLTFARHLRDQIIYHQRQQIQGREVQRQLQHANSSNRPQTLPARPTTPQVTGSNEDNEDFDALAQQWRQLRDGSLLQGISGEVLRGSFSVAAEVELGRLDGLGESERVREAREVWREVVRLAAECRDVKGEVQSALLGGSLGSGRHELGWVGWVQDSEEVDWDGL